MNSDTRLDSVRAAMKGNDEAFYQLMQEHKAKLYRIALTYLKNEDDALEAVQETTFRAYSRIGKLREPKYFGTWLVRLMLNYCIDELRSRDRERRHLPALFAAAGDDGGTTDDFHRHVERLGLEMAIRTMEPRFQTVIRLKYFEDMTIADIARTMDRPEGTIKTWLHKALIGLRTVWEKEGK